MYDTPPPLPRLPKKRVTPALRYAVGKAQAGGFLPQGYSRDVEVYFTLDGAVGDYKDWEKVSQAVGLQLLHCRAELSRARENAAWNENRFKQEELKLDALRGTLRTLPWWRRIFLPTFVRAV